MHRSRGREVSGRGRANHGSKITKVLLKGLFSDGIWKCNCDPRLPAQRLQTKNGGINHGRWFYNCQHPQPKRCDFFLWDDEAKVREAAVVLNNSRTEPEPLAPVTPSKPLPRVGFTTPQMGSRYKGWDTEEFRTPHKTPSKGPGGGKKSVGGTQATPMTAEGSDEDFYEWATSDEEELEKTADEVLSHRISTEKKEMPPPPPPQLPETPSKAVVMDAMSTSGKRGYDEMVTAIGRQYPTPATTMRVDDVFATTHTAGKSGKGLFANKPFGLASPAETPTPIRYKEVPTSADSELTSEVLTTLALHAIALPADAREALKSICNRHVLHTRGITRGREVSRAMVKTKEEKIAEMQIEIDGLKSEREANIAVIRHLRAQRKETMR